MGQLSLLAASGVVALFGWGFVTKVLRQAPPGKAVIEKRMQSDGTMRADGTIKVDSQFDKELNALRKELDAIDQDAAKQLDALSN